jgi:hypothetical protein
MMSHSDKLEAAFTKEAKSPLSWLLSAARKAPTWSKGKASLPLRHAAGQWMTNTGDVASSFGSLLSRRAKVGGKVSEFGKRLIDQGDNMHLEGLRQSGISDRIMPRLKPRTKYTGGYWNPMERGKHMWDTKGEIGQRANPLNWGKGLHRRGVAAGLTAGSFLGVPGSNLGVAAYLTPAGLAGGGLSKAFELATLPMMFGHSPVNYNPDTLELSLNRPKPKYNNIVRNPQALRRYT